jgi:formamidopyrimidine-DNA glycosylase
MFDDLQQLFGYQGAIDERTGVRELGPDLLETSFDAETAAQAVKNEGRRAIADSLSARR